MTGTVKFFNGSKGFGFITNDETGEDIFVHVTSLDGINLNEGDKVSYNEGEGRKGKMATCTLSSTSCTSGLSLAFKGKDSK